MITLNFNYGDTSKEGTINFFDAQVENLESQTNRKTKKETRRRFQ